MCVGRVLDVCAVDWGQLYRAVETSSSRTPSRKYLVYDIIKVNYIA